MIKDTTMKNGKVVRVQLAYAPRKWVSSMGTAYKKGDLILHLSSSRATGESFMLTPEDIEKVRKSKVDKWAGKLSVRQA